MWSNFFHRQQEKRERSYIGMRLISSPMTCTPTHIILILLVENLNMLVHSTRCIKSIRFTYNIIRIGCGQSTLSLLLLSVEHTICRALFDISRLWSPFHSKSLGVLIAQVLPHGKSHFLFHFRSLLGCSIENRWVN